MNKPQDSDYIQHLLAGFVLDDLTPTEDQEFRQLILQRPDLLTEIEDLQATLGLVVDGFTDQEAPAHLLNGILQTAEADLRQQPPVPKRITFPWRKLAGGIAALLVVALGIDYFRLRQDLGTAIAENQRLRQDFAQAQTVQTLLRGPKARLFTLQASNASERASGSLIMNAEQRRAMMILQNLPAPPPGKVYVLWVVIAGKKLTCGEIKPYAWGDAAYELPFTPEMMRDFYHPNFAGMVVTLETDPKVIRPAGPMVMQSSQI
jgi:hypothetical protein